MLITYFPVYRGSRRTVVSHGKSYRRHSKNVWNRPHSFTCLQLTFYQQRLAIAMDWGLVRLKHYRRRKSPHGKITMNDEDMSMNLIRYIVFRFIYFPGLSFLYRLFRTLACYLLLKISAKHIIFSGLKKLRYTG